MKHRQKKHKRKLAFVVITGQYTSDDLQKLSNIDGVAVVSEDNTFTATVIFNRQYYPIRDIYTLVYNTHDRIRCIMRGSKRFKEFDKLHIN